MVFFFIRKRSRFKKMEILWGKKSFPSIQANLLLKGFAKEPDGRQLLETTRRHEDIVESILSLEPKVGKGPAAMLDVEYSQWFFGLRRAREDQLSTEHKFLIEFSYFALREMEAGGRVLPEAIEIIRERTARVGVEYQKVCDAKTVDELFPK